MNHSSGMEEMLVPLQLNLPAGLTEYYVWPLVQEVLSDGIGHCLVAKADQT